MHVRGRAVALGLASICLLTGACTPHARFDAMRAELAAMPEGEPPPPLPGLSRYRGVIHVHSSLSHDSDGDLDEIVRSARQAGLDFIMMTDHNRPELFSREFDGLHDGVLVIRGAEFRVDGDYLLGLGLSSYIDSGGLTFSQVSTAIREQGGVAIGAHPRRFRHWADPALTGVEVWDLYDEATIDRWRYVKLSFDIVFSYDDYPEEILLAIVRHPAEALAEFDAQTRRRRFVAIGAPDAHQNIRVIHQLDPYPLAFRLVPTYLLAEAQTRKALLDALRRGRGYIAFDLLAPAEAFDFRLVDDTGGLWVMGDEPPLGPGQSLRVSAPRRGRITVLKDGRPIRVSDATRAVVPVTEPGVYRAEVALSLQGRWRPWIYSNPIYVR